MTQNYFRAFGALVLLLNTPVLFGGLATAGVSLTPPQSLAWFFSELVPLLAIALVGLGLLFLRKWAALYFSVPLFWFGVQEAFTSIYQVPFPVNLLVMLHGLSLTLPLVVTICIWKQLTWGRRFF